MNVSEELQTGLRVYMAREKMGQARLAARLSIGCRKVHAWLHGRLPSLADMAKVDLLLGTGGRFTALLKEHLRQVRISRPKKFRTSSIRVYSLAEYAAKGEKRIHKQDASQANEKAA
jgi:hypothetical protein